MLISVTFTAGNHYRRPSDPTVPAEWMQVRGPWEGAGEGYQTVETRADCAAQTAARRTPEEEEGFWGRWSTCGRVHLRLFFFTWMWFKKPVKEEHPITHLLYVFHLLLVGSGHLVKAVSMFQNIIFLFMKELGLLGSKTF